MAKKPLGAPGNVPNLRIKIIVFREKLSYREKRVQLYQKIVINTIMSVTRRA